ncbi:uncharacterized protein LOC135492693 [Lineus longissimus]|uniref:uncharacterized protein LOC135492693 n=1 Tax=Lineus longissimus TaxID=88925 RepID=UPI002B4F862E
MSQRSVRQDRMRQSKDLDSNVIRELSPGSMEEIEILEAFYKTFLDIEKQRPIHDISISAVKNPELERQFIKKRNEMYLKGCTDDELKEQFVFNLTKVHVAKQIARYGLFCKRKARNSIGDGAYGVILSMHADVALEWGACYGYKPPLAVVVYKVIHGRVRTVQEQVNPNARPLPPTSDYTSHMAKIKPTPSMVLTNRVDRSYVYIYDYDTFNNLKVRPRQVLPYAIINIKTDLLKFFGLQVQSSIPKVLVSRSDSQRDWSPNQRINNRDRSPIPRPGKDQRDWSPGPRTVTVEPRLDRRVVDLSAWQKGSAQENRGHRSQSRSSSSRWGEDRSKTSLERISSSRCRDGSSSRSRDHSPTQHGRGGSEESVRRKKNYESGECTDTDGVPEQDDVMQRIVKDDGKIILKVACSHDASTSRLERREQSRSRPRHRSRDRSKHHSNTRKRSYSRHSRRSRSKEKNREKSWTRSRDKIAAEDIDQNNNQFRFEEEEILNRELCDIDVERSVSTTPTAGLEFEGSSSRNNSGRKLASGSAHKAGDFRDLREMLSGPPQGVPDLREKLTISDLRHRLSSVPVPDLRDKICTAPLPDLRETLVGNTLPDLRESLAIKRKFQPGDRRFVGTCVSPREVQDPRDPVMYEDIETFTAAVQQKEEPQIWKQKIQTELKLEGDVKKESQIDYSFHDKSVTSQYDSEVALSDLPEISDVEVKFEDEGLTTVNDTDDESVDDTDDGFRTVDDTDASDKLVINESPFQSSTERTSEWNTARVAESPLPIIHMNNGALTPSKKGVIVCSPCPITEQKVFAPSEENWASNSPLPQKLEDTFSTPKRFMVTDFMSPRSPGTPDTCIPEFRSLSSRFGSLKSCSKDSGSDQEKITKASLLDSPSAMNLDSSFSVVENLRKIRVSVEESLSRSHPPLVGLDRVDGEIKLATVQPMETSSETQIGKIRKRKLDEKISVVYNSNDTLDKGVDAPKIRKLDVGVSGCRVEDNPGVDGKLRIEKISVDCNGNDISGVNSSEVKPFDVEGLTTVMNDNPECSSSSSSSATSDPSSVTTEFIIEALLEQKKLAETDQDREAVENAVNILMQNLNAVEHAIKAELVSKMGGGALGMEEQNWTISKARPESLLRNDAFTSVTSLERDNTGSDLSQLGEDFDVNLDEFEELDDTFCQDDSPSPTANHDEESVCEIGRLHVSPSGSSLVTSAANVLVELSNDSAPSVDIIPTIGVEIQKHVDFICESKSPENSQRVSQTDYWDLEKTKRFSSVETLSVPASICEDEKENCWDKTNMNLEDMDMDSGSDDDTGIEFPPPMSYSTSTASRNLPPNYVEHDEMYSPMQRLEGIYSSNNYKASGWQSNNDSTGRGFAPPRHASRYDQTNNVPRKTVPPFKRNYGFVHTEGSAPLANLRNSDKGSKVEREEGPGSLFSKGMRYEDAIIDTQSVPRNRRESGDQNVSLTAAGTVYSDNNTLQNRDRATAGQNTYLQQSCLMQVQNRTQYIPSNSHPSASAPASMINLFSHAPSGQGAKQAQHMQNSQPYFYNEHGSHVPTLHGCNAILNAALDATNRPVTATLASVDPATSDGAEFSPDQPSPPPPPKQAVKEEESSDELIMNINTSGSFLNLHLPLKSPEKTWPALKRVTVGSNYPSTVAPARPTFYDYGGVKMQIRYAEEVTANVKTHPGLGVVTQTLTTGQTVHDTKKYFEERRRDREVGSKSSLFHGRTLLKGQVSARKIPLEPLYLQHPYKKSGKLELIPTDPRPAYYSMLRREKTKGLTTEHQGTEAAGIVSLFVRH